jgi:hypothetical protein
MASEIGIRAAQQGSIYGEPPGDDKAGDRGDSGPQYTTDARRLNRTSTFEKPAQVVLGR